MGIIAIKIIKKIAKVNLISIKNKNNKEAIKIIKFLTKKDNKLLIILYNKLASFVIRDIKSPILLFSKNSGEILIIWL
jgi:hypothetical protein